MTFKAVPIRVCLHRKCIDIISTYQVLSTREKTLDALQRSLIQHDHYDPAITVRFQRMDRPL